MSDLKLVAPEEPTPFERQLLEAVANESPSAEQRARVRLALGLPALPAAPLPVPALGRRAWLLKAAGGVIVVSVAVIALLSTSGRKPSSAEQPAAPSATQPSIAAATVVAPSLAAPTLATPTRAEPTSAVPEAAAAVPAPAQEASVPNKRASKAATVENGADLSEQLRLIDAARSAVAAGNAGAASAALASYRTRFPRGPFGQEAAVLQIQTLDLQGNHAEAAARARSFLARHPNSPHVSVVQRIAGR